MYEALACNEKALIKNHIITRFSKPFNTLNTIQTSVYFWNIFQKSISFLPFPEIRSKCLFLLLVIYFLESLWAHTKEIRLHF